MIKTYFLLACLCWAGTLLAQDNYSVNCSHPVVPVPPTLWGLFFEDINRAADGGFYAEMIENRSFDFPKPLMAWTTWPSPRLRDGIFMVINQSAADCADPKYMHITTRETEGTDSCWVSAVNRYAPACL